MDEGDRTQSEELCRRAADQLPSHRPELLAELAIRLLRADDSVAAVRIFRELDRLPPGAQRSFARALIDVDELGEAQELIERAGANGLLPDWAVVYAAEIAHRRNDPEVASRHLEDLVRRGRADTALRLTLIDTLLGLDQHALAASRMISAEQPSAT